MKRKTAIKKSELREELIFGLVRHANGKLAYHKANIEVYLQNPAGIGEHSNILEAIEVELDSMSKYQEQLDVIDQYFRTD